MPVRPVVSLIVSSYNQPNALALVLEGVLTQTRPVDELVVADDGSEPDTAAPVDEFAAGPAFATAGYVLMSLARTEALSIEHVATAKIDELCTPDERRQFHRIHRREQSYRLLRKAKKPKILGGNWAVTRAGLVAVNGFDEMIDGSSARRTPTFATAWPTPGSGGGWCGATTGCAIVPTTSIPGAIWRASSAAPRTTRTTRAGDTPRPVSLVSSSRTPPLDRRYSRDLP